MHSMCQSLPKLCPSSARKMYTPPQTTVRQLTALALNLAQDKGHVAGRRAVSVANAGCELNARATMTFPVFWCSAVSPPGVSVSCPGASVADMRGPRALQRAPTGLRAAAGRTCCGPCRPVLGLLAGPAVPLFAPGISRQSAARTCYQLGQRLRAGCPGFDMDLQDQ